jgi:hypothetical protein
MNKKFKDNESAGVSTLLTGLIFSITFSSVLIAFVLLQFYGVAVIAVNGVDSPINLPMGSEIKTFSSSQDFKNGTFDLQTIGKMKSGRWRWSDGVGYELTMLGSDGGYYYLVIDNIQSDDGIYQNSYWLNNSATNAYGMHGDYCITLRGTGGIDNNEVCVTNEGFYIPANFATKIGSGQFSMPYAGASQIVNPSIKTVYNDNTPSVDFYFQGQKVFSTTTLNADFNLFGLFGRYFGGVCSSTIGFTIEAFQTGNPITNIDNQQNGLALVFGFLMTVIKIVVWNVDSMYLPIELNIIFIKTQLCAVAVCVIMIIRGVS